ncbi:hypothetical protein JCGZ_16269 [Jatropha curcas]|uniref:S-protein homolog n=1 Tax=Jatropha curcas TaxID=180498 RepID=A0A067L7K4_JATCU|nr:hypothetical protein JCGZ_16269 [Jatropha curcas]
MTTRSLWFLTMFLLVLSRCEGWMFPKTQTVNVTNVLGLDLTVHCKSKDDDLGVKLLHHNGYFTFRFKPNFVDNTLFYCSFAWKNNFHWFDIYSVQRDDDKCDDNYCSWIVQPLGPCMWNKDKKIFNDCFPWNKA